MLISMYKEVGLEGLNTNNLVISLRFKLAFILSLGLSNNGIVYAFFHRTKNPNIIKAPLTKNIPRNTKTFYENMI